MKKTYLFLLGLIFCSHAVFADELTYVRPKTAILDIELSQVNLIVAPHDEDRIAYRYELKEGKKLSCIETFKTLRIRELKPAEGTLYLFIPKTTLLESCSFRSTRADISAEGLQTVRLLVTVNIGSLSLKECRLKTAVMNLARGNIQLTKTEIVRSCSIAVTQAHGSITFPREAEQYHLNYVHNGGTLTIDSTEYTKSPGEYGNPKAKRSIMFSGGVSTISIAFAKKEELP